MLVNNAAIHYDTQQQAGAADLSIVREALETNLLGAWQVTQALLPLLRRSEHGRIVNVSSEGGSLTNMGGGIPAYRTSKAALNALTRLLAAELRGDRILVNSVCPGWVATDMGGPGGRPVEEGASSIIWAVDLPDSGPTGGFYRDGRPLAVVNAPATVAGIDRGGDSIFIPLLLHLSARWVTLGMHQGEEPHAHAQRDIFILSQGGPRGRARARYRRRHA